MARILCKVLKDFPYADDGNHAERLKAGDVREIQSDVVPGLVAEGYVEEAAPEAEKSSGPQIVDAKKKDHFDVIGADGEKVNEKPLTQDAAEALLAEITKPIE